MAYIDYRTYIKSPEWKARALTFKKSAGYKCQLCSKVGDRSSLHVHHNNYDALGEEGINDVIVLCADCHAKFHDKYADKPNPTAPKFVDLPPYILPPRRENAPTTVNPGETADERILSVLLGRPQAKRTLSVTLRDSGDETRDALRFRRVVGLICTYPGEHRFEIYFRDDSGGEKRTETPDYRIDIDTDLLARLFLLCGSENVRVIQAA